MASRYVIFYPRLASPQEYYHDVFAAERDSSNRVNRAGHEVICIPMHDGYAGGSYEDFLTSLVTKDVQAWGRHAGVAIAKTAACSSSTTAPDRTSPTSANRV
jgi:glucose/arabinose dehydrogenase